jgi:hypothetical protein
MTYEETTNKYLTCSDESFYYKLLLAIMTISFNDNVFNGLATVAPDDDDSLGSL